MRSQDHGFTGRPLASPEDAIRSSQESPLEIPSQPLAAGRLAPARLLLRRFLVLAVLFFWQGGFTFYASVVVPVGQQVLGGHLRQGFVTRQVTYYLNLAGAIALLPLAWDLLASWSDSRWIVRLRMVLWLILLVTLGVLFWLRQRLDSLLVSKGFILLDEEAFRPLHALYLWISTVQWACALAYLLLTLQVWRSLDRQSRTP